MSAAPYIPYGVPERKNPEISTTRKRALATMMGVGEILAKVRTMLATEEGELDVDEDEHGSLIILLVVLLIWFNVFPNCFFPNSHPLLSL